MIDKVEQDSENLESFPTLFPLGWWYIENNESITLLFKGLTMCILKIGFHMIQYNNFFFSTTEYKMRI